MYSDVGERCFMQNNLTGVERSRLALHSKISAEMWKLREVETCRKLDAVTATV